MKVNRKELVDILSALRPGLEKKEIVQQTCHFIFFKDEIAVYNGSVCISFPFESETEFSVKGEEFFRLINGIPDEEIDLIIKNKTIQVLSENTSSKMALLSEELNILPEKIKLLEEKMSKWKVLPTNFLEALSLCYFSASPDLTKGVKACVCLLGDKCYATDTYRASLYEMNSVVEDDFNIPARTVMELIKFPVIEYCLSNNWLCFRTEEGLIFSCSHIEGQLPIDKIDKLLEELETLSVTEIPQELKQTITEVMMLASDDSHIGKNILISLGENKLLVKAQNELGYVEKNIEVDYENDPLAFATNSNFILQILEKSNEMYVGEKSLFFAIPNFKHVMMKSKKVEVK